MFNYRVDGVLLHDEELDFMDRLRESPKSMEIGTEPHFVSRLSDYSLIYYKLRKDNHKIRRYRLTDHGMDVLCKIYPSDEEEGD